MPNISAQFDLIVNKHSLQVLERGEAQIRDDISRAMGDTLDHVAFVDAPDLKPAVTDYFNAKAKGAGDDTPQKQLIVGGGDGSSLTMVDVAMEQNRADDMLAFLPLGTSNHLTNRLGFSSEYAAAAKQMAEQAKPCELEVATLNDMPFMLSANLDPSSVRVFEGREHLRHKRYGKVISCAAQSFKELYFSRNRIKMDITCRDDAGGEDHILLNGRAMFASVNRLEARAIFAPNNEKTGFARVRSNLLHTVNDHDGRLHLDVFAGGLRNLFGISRAAVNGTWTDHRSITHMTATEFEIMAEGNGMTAGAPITVALDAEMRQTTMPIVIKKFAKPLNVLGIR